MHLQEDIMHVELEPVDATHVRPIITDFTRTSVPIVRYRMTDVLAMRTTACPCGSPLRAVERIVGRDDDVLLFYDEGGRVVPVYPDVLSRRIAVATDTFRAYRIRQDTSNTVRLQLDCDASVYDETFATIERAIAAVCADQGIRGISIVEEPYAEIPSAVKTRRIQRTFNAMVEDRKL
jgi:putative adenylate-forming enzyme